MNTSQPADVFGGDLHGFLIYPAAWQKPHDHYFTPLRTLKHMHAAEHGVQLPNPSAILPKARRSARFRYDHEPPPYQSSLGLRRRIQLANGLLPAAPRGNDAIRALVADYTHTRGPEFGVPPLRPTPRMRLDPVFSVRTADAFERAKHAPQDPAVQAAYQQLIREITAQYDHAVAHGFRFEPWLQPGQPYANSQQMSADAGTGHLWFFPTNNPHEVSFGTSATDQDPAFNPLVVKTGHVVNGYEMTANDLLRGVHDLYAHAKEGHEFGPEGEYNAWAEHAKTLSPLAAQALTTETHGQNSWVNFGPHLRRPDGSIPRKGEPDWVHPQQRPFAEQKSAILPPDVHPPHPYQQPLRMELPNPLGGAVFASSHDKPDTLTHEQAVSKLFDDKHTEFLNMADDATRRYLDLPHDHAGAYTHLHGIGSWENAVEPSMMTVFHRPVDSLQLQRIGADIGTWARQHAILAFSPHPGGFERLLHMRLKTHHPTPRIPQPVLASISQRIHDEFNNYFDPQENGGQSFWIPGRTILPDHTGHTDVLAWVPPWEEQPDRVHQAFTMISRRLGSIRPPTFWPGTGVMLGGTSPYSDEEAKFLTDAQKRDAAVANYAKVMAEPGKNIPALGAEEFPLVRPTPPARRSGGRMVTLRDILGRFKQRLARSPAVTGAVVRGVYYAPGKMMPDATPIKTDAAPDTAPTHGVLARIRKRFKKNRHASATTTRIGYDGSSPPGGYAGSGSGTGTAG